MILSLLLSATFTFNVTATGVEKGTAIEFIVAGPNTDRAYESMFLLDEPVDVFCRRLDAMVPRGTPVDVASCRLWPTGCNVRFEPSFDQFVAVNLPEGDCSPMPIYTGGTRRPDGTIDASDTMPAAVFSTYSIPQAPFVYRVPVDQGSAYGKFTAAVKLEKGAKFTFNLIIDEKSLPAKLDLTAEKGNVKEILKRLQSESRSGEVDASVSFSGNLTVDESVAVARALSVIDSPRVKLNGAHGLFYQAFLPLEKWRDRRERLPQPFELALKPDGSDELLFIEEDWTVEGDDPKLVPHRISFDQTSRYPRTNACLIFTSKTQTVDRISAAMNRFKGNQVVNWYVFSND